MFPHRKPNKVDQDLTDALGFVLETWKIELPFGWRLYVTDTVRGRTRYDRKDITVPKWAFNTDKIGYEIYYACHEIAHILAPAKKGNHHGAEFMAAFKKICPVEFQHYELGYKPRLAKAAGIRRPK